MHPTPHAHTFRTSSPKARALALALLLLVNACAAAPAAAQQPAAATPAPRSPALPQKFSSEGMTVEFDAEAGAGREQLKEGADAFVTFRINDARTKAPLSGARPAAWLSRRQSGATTDPAACRQKIQSFMQGSLRARPEVDLNSYQILALNSEPNISVIDPLMGFGGSKLVTLVMLKSPGEDWAFSADGARLFVSMPEVNQVAVVDTTTWKVAANIETAPRPARVRLSPDGRQLWVGTDGAAPTDQSGVTVIEAATLKVAGQVLTGAGHHEIAFSPDSSAAFVTNRADGTLSVVDPARLARVADVKVVASPAALDYSSAARAVYVVGESDAHVVAVDPARRQVSARIEARPGLRSIRFAPGGRYGFVTNGAESAVHVFDAATNRLLHTLPVGKSPDQIAFTGEFAYVRSAESEKVSMIRLSTVSKEPDVMTFPGGQSAPAAAGSPAPGQLLAPPPEPGSMLVANPADKMIYYYTEGMAAPMGSFQNYKREPRALLVHDRSLRETSPGVFRAPVKLPAAGVYDVAFLLDSPRAVNCFELAVAEDPSAPKRPQASLRVEYLNQKGEAARANQPFKLSFKLTDAVTARPADDLRDVRVLCFLAPGIWQQRNFARAAGGGLYEFEVTPPQPGVYMFFVESPSRGVAFRQLPFFTLQVDAAP